MPHIGPYGLRNTLMRFPYPFTTSRLNNRCNTVTLLKFALSRIAVNTGLWSQLSR